MNAATHLRFEAEDGLRLGIRLFDTAPRTLARLRACLPMAVDLHCAKIAGNHVLWHAPFLAPAEAAADVLSLPPGAFLYWPERQFLELVYAPLQAETATVTPLGQVEGAAEVAALAELGARVQRDQGRRMLWARLDGAPAAAARPAAGDPRLAPLHAARRAIWAGPPGEIATLMRSRAVMHPAGPLLMAEGEARKLHEAATALWLRADAETGRAAWAGALATRQAVARLAGFCGLHGPGAALAQAARLLEDAPDLAAPVLEQVALIAGRLAAWLDARIPWAAVTAACVAADDAFDYSSSRPPST